jgi:hypothetical protein
VMTGEPIHLLDVMTGWLNILLRCDDRSSVTFIGCDDRKGGTLSSNMVTPFNHSQLYDVITKELHLVYHIL